MPTKPNIPGPLRTHMVPIDTIHPWPGNPRKGDVDDIADSLKEGGQWRVAVVQKSSGNICVGNNMWHAAKKLGWESLAAITLELTDDKARRMLARDNRASDKGTYDVDLLTDLLSDLADTELGLGGTGYDDDDLDDLIKTTGSMADETADFLNTFIEPGTDTTPATAGNPPPVVNPFPVNGTPQTPAGPSIPAQAAPADEPSTPGTTPNPVHTGPAVYQGPGAPSPAGTGAALPDAAPLANLQYAVTIEQRDTIRSALKLAHTVGGYTDTPAAVTALAVHYLATAGADAKEATA